VAAADSPLCNHLLTPDFRLEIFTLKMEAIRCSETSVHATSTQRHIPDDILHSHRFYSLKSYTIQTVFVAMIGTVLLSSVESTRARIEHVYSEL
jgi:hypothetical protein